LARTQLDGDEESRKAMAVQTATEWVLKMQSSNGGWAAFDRDNNKRALAEIPFADFMTPLDPTSPDVTAHVLELLGELGGGHVQVKKARRYLLGQQLADGAWYGRWGVNYIYGTGLVLAGLHAIGEDMAADHVIAGVNWLKLHQNPDGGWGETCKTYDDPNCRGGGTSTASQTAWALLGLIAADQGGSPAARRGIKYLLETQEHDGSWTEDYYTGTGFPRAFYLRYDFYRLYFPLMVLGQYRAAQSR
jgi:squalene-hopene/tetraprenyl-beta-curcumene cyclase